MLNLALLFTINLLALSSLLSRRAKVGRGRAALVEEATEERGDEGVEDDPSAAVTNISILVAHNPLIVEIVLTRTGEWPSREQGRT